jgi:Family of unknown function (DUF5335)
MTTCKLDKRQWRTVFGRLSKTLEGKQPEIEVASLCLGDQVEAAWSPMEERDMLRADWLVAIVQNMALTAVHEFAGACFEFPGFSFR